MVASAAIASSAVADDVDQLPIVDTHHHLWDLGKFRLPWQKDKPTLARNFVMSDYLAAVRGKNVVKTVYMEVDVEVSQQSAEIEYVSAICREGKSPMVAAVVSGRPASDEFSQYVAKHRENPYLRGIRQVLHNPEMPAGFCLDPKFVAGVRLLGSVGWSFDLCMRSTELNDAAKLIDACPDTRFVLDHCGNASLQAKDLSAWRRDIAALAERKNVIGKVSGIIASAPRPGEWTIEGLATIVNHTLAAFGPDRVVFGGDWPVCTLGAELGQWIDALKTIVRDRPATEQRKLFHDNAVKFYRLA
jgi:predicted TIM-barrel fold metal-dependent hydrolase